MTRWTHGKSRHILTPIALIGTAALLLGACGDDDSGEYCGNGQLETGEACDGADLGGLDCTDVGNYTGGILGCTSQCTFDTGMCTASLDCGNGTLEGTEDCDGANLNGQTCADLGAFTGGTLACAGDCTFDTGGCTGGGDCGNGTVDAGEDCDGADLDGQTCADVGNFSGGDLACYLGCTFDTTGCTAASDCPRHDLGSETSLTYNGDTTGLPNLVTSPRLEWQDAPDDALLFTAPVAGDYEIVTTAEPSSNQGCGASVWNYGTDTYYDASWCPAPGSTTEIDGGFTSAGYPYTFAQGETVLIWFSCSYWATPLYGPYEITINLQ